MHNFLHEKPSPASTAPKPNHNWERVPNLEVIIQTKPTPSTHSCLPRHLENSTLYVIILYLLQYIFFSMKIQAQQAQEQNRARASPPGTTCLIGKNEHNLSPHRCSPASSHSPWHAKTSQMGLPYPATPEIYNFLPEILPNVPNSEHNHLPATSGIVDVCLPATPTCPQQPHPIIHPHPPTWHP
jgi:hypothetical protein